MNRDRTTRSESTSTGPAALEPTRLRWVPGAIQRPSRIGSRAPLTVQTMSASPTPASAAAAAPPARRPLAHRAGHDAERPAAAQRDDRAQQLARLAAREGDHGAADERDAGLVGQAFMHLFAVDHAHPG